MAVLADPLLQKFLFLRPNAEASSRISNWLMACLGDVASGDADSEIFLDMIEVMHDYAVATKVCAITWSSWPVSLTLRQTLPPILLTFFAQFLSIWNGSDKRDIVLECLSFAPLIEFEGIYLHGTAESYFG